MSIKPALQSLWLVDDARQDPVTGKMDVIGRFDAIEVEWPATHYTSRGFLYFVLTGMHGKERLTLRYANLADLAVLVERQFTLQASGPLDVQDVCIHVPAMPVPHPGVYAWELYWENEMLGSSRVTASVVRKPGQKE